MRELVLVVDRRNTELTLEGGALRVSQGDGKPDFVPVGLLGLVVLRGNPKVPPGVLRVLAERGVAVALLPQRGAGKGTWVGEGLANSIAVRVAQHRVAAAPRGGVIAARIAHAKVERYAALARQQDMAVAVELERFAGGLGETESADKARGLEGAAASAWWAALGEHLDARWRFRGRNRRPPRDPVNALLSLGYTLVGAEVSLAVRALGLDPALGFLHGVVPGRESLVLDLLEPLRAGVDAWVLRWVTGGALAPSDFTFSKADGCRLNKKARGAFYSLWSEARMEWFDPLQPGDPLPDLCRQWALWLREQLGAYDPQTGQAVD